MFSNKDLQIEKYLALFERIIDIIMKLLGFGNATTVAPETTTVAETTTAAEIV
jgi:hypothetical protein